MAGDAHGLSVRYPRAVRRECLLRLRPRFEVVAELSPPRVLLSQPTRVVDGRPHLACRGRRRPSE